MAKAAPPTGAVKHHGAILNDEGIAALMGESHGWNPQDGDELRGTVLGAKLGYSDISEKEYPIVFVLLDEGKEITIDDQTFDVIAVHCFQASLLSEMRSQRPERGDRIYIKRIGERGEPKRRGYNAPIVFVVSVSKPAGKSTSIWETFGPQQQPSTVPTGAQSSFDDEPPF